MMRLMHLSLINFLTFWVSMILKILYSKNTLLAQVLTPVWFQSEPYIPDWHATLGMIPGEPSF